MAPSLLLTPLAPTPDKHPFGAVDTRAKRTLVPPLDVAPTHPICAGPSESLGLVIPTSTSTSTSTSTTSGEPASAAHRTPARPWTGAPIRAIVPLPRRAHATSTSAVAQDGTRSPRSVTSPNAPITLGLPSPLASATHAWDDADSTDAEHEHDGNEDGEDGGSDAECEPASPLRYCAYESISAADGLSSWSFEVRTPPICVRGLTDCAGTAGRVLRPIPYRARHQATPCGAAFPRYSACLCPSYRSTPAELGCASTLYSCVPDI